MSGSESERSAEACPRCGAHQLTLLRFPQVDVLGIRPYDDLIGMGDVQASTEPGIGCLACGAEWPDLAAYRAERGRAS